MAAKDNEGFQQFPNACTTLPEQPVLEEEIELNLSLSEGQQSIAESEEDPYNRAVKYLEEHHIIEVFQNIASQLAFHQPKDPLEFMLAEIEKVRSGKKLDELLNNK